MIKSLRVSQFGILPSTTFEFSKGINVIVGSNATGKSQLLKLGYTASRWSYDMSLSSRDGRPDKATLQKALALKLVRVFRPNSLGRLTKRGVGRQRCSVAVKFYPVQGIPRLERLHRDFRFSFSTNSSTEVSLDLPPDGFSNEEVVFFPTKEVLSMYPGFTGVYRSRELSFDETYYDLCLALDKSLSRGPRQEAIRPQLEEIERVLKGKIRLENNHFYLQQPKQGKFEIALVAEGLRKMGTVAYLLANGTLEKQSVLFWDEPETNLNPRLMRQLAEILVTISKSDTQVILSTHSLFMLRELSMLVTQEELDARFFALGGEEGVSVQVTSGSSAEEIEPIVSLEEEIAQSERYLASEIPD